MAKIDIRTALLQGVINANAGGLPVKWPNLPTQNANSTAPVEPTNQPWIRANILSMDSEVWTLGATGKNRVFGALQLTVFVPAATGDLGAFTQAGLLESVFKTGAVLSYNGDNVRILSADYKPGPEENQWYSLVISVNYESYLARG